MSRLHTLVLLAALAPASLAHAQTGPIGGPGTNNPPLPPANSGVSQGLTPDHLATYFRNQGQRVDANTVNGVTFLKVQMQRDGWNYLFTIEFTQDQKSFLLSMPFSNTTSMPATQLQEILKASFRIHPFHFNIRNNNNTPQLWMDGPYFNTSITEDVFQRILDQFLKAVRDSQPAWDSSRWTAAVVPAAGSTPAGGSTPVGSSTPVNNAASGSASTQGLANTTWVGTENLANYGRLEFRFQANGQVTMIDTAGSHPGTYVVQGNRVTMTFGGVVYSGTLSGNTISGNANNVGNAQQKWSFSVSR
jgi:hypothetical protein